MFKGSATHLKSTPESSLPVLSKQTLLPLYELTDKESGRLIFKGVLISLVETLLQRVLFFTFWHYSLK